MIDKTLLPTVFTVPVNGQAYCYDIKERCTNLIESQIWSGLKIEKFEAWLANFQTDEEKYFSACVLDALIYRSNLQTESLLLDLFTRNLNDVIRINKIPLSIDLISLLKSKSNNEIRITSLLDENANFAESGSHILREIKRKGFAKDSWVINPNLIPEARGKGVNIFIFIDDFLGTGNQFKDCCVKHNLKKLMEEDNVIIIYAPLVGHELTISNLKQEFPRLIITVVDHFESDYSFFSNYFNDQSNTPETAKEFYLGLLSKMGIDNPKSNYIFGYGNLEFVYAFEHGTPNNSLQILKHNRNWNPLLD